VSESCIREDQLPRRQVGTIRSMWDYVSLCCTAKVPGADRGRTAAVESQGSRGCGGDRPSNSCAEEAKRGPKENPKDRDCVGNGAFEESILDLILLQRSKGPSI
jgi:hypothetical protein